MGHKAGQGLGHRGAKAAAAMLAILAAAIAAKPAHAAEPRSFHQAVEDAWALLPQRAAFAARQSVAAARYRTGGAFLPDAPALAGSFVNDRLAGSNNGYITTQMEASTPIWLPGEGTALQRTARAQGMAAEAAVDAAHLELAAQVLDVAARVAATQNARDVAARRLATAQALSADLARRFAVGESAQSDALAAEADAASASVSLSGADADRAAARSELEALTGSPAPCRLAAPLPPPEADAAPAAVARHPSVLAAERAVAAAQENARLVRIQDRDDPQLGVEGINEKQPGTRWDTRFGVTLKFSFATEARNGPRRAEAEQATTQAMVQLALARRQVAVAVRQAQAMLAGAERSQAASDRAAAALARRRGQIDRAWTLGEMPLIEVVRAHAASFDADLARDRARTDLDAARLRLVLAEGTLP